MNKNIIIAIALVVLFLLSTAGAVEGTTNLVQNPGFESGKTSWTFYTNVAGPTFNTVSPGSEGIYSAKLAFSKVGTNMQLYQSGIKLEPNTKYRLSFAAYSTTGHDVTLKLFKQVSPYTNYGLLNTFDLGTSWQVFNYEFTTKGFTGIVSDGRFQFWLASSAAAGDIYYIDTIILEKSGADTTPPTVIGNTPIGTNVPVTTQITLTFNEPMNQASAQTAFSTSPATSGSFSWSGNKMTYTPGSSLPASTTYTVTIGTSAKDLAGNSLQSPYSWSFTTSGASSSIEARLAALEAKNTALEANMTALKIENTALKSNVTTLKNLLAGVSRNGNNIYIDGANLHIRDGSGDTFGPVNGLGNLIIGYNELRGSNDKRTGSHNLILGKANNYASYGGLVAGVSNEISGPYASISGGLQNKASNWFSSISGGNNNTASGWHSSVSGGIYNTANGEDSSVSGGYGNTASGNYSSVSGGNNNTASGGYTSVSGGTQNTASNARIGEYNAPEEYVTYAWSAASVSGGYGNTASGLTSTVSGGENNIASGSSSSVSGGGYNQALEAYSPNGNSHGSLASISGGVGNIADGSASSISGGTHNYAGGCCDSDYASVSGGHNNIAIGMFSSVSGGQYNRAEGESSSISGGANNIAGSLFEGASSSISGGYQRNATGTYDWVAGELFQDQ